MTFRSWVVDYFTTHSGSLTTYDRHLLKKEHRLLIQEDHDMGKAMEFKISEYSGDDKTVSHPF